MIHPRLLAPLGLALTLAATPAFPQPAPAEPARGQTSASENTTDTTKAAPQSPAPDQPTAKSTDATTGKKSSPFDYHSSEEISEDVPVSFPVDI